ncbi:MAG: penicillin amidase [Solirubrobacteraceae bacterium]|nr:penicillin amidase [Solirubrobacteraceae bacterium]
MKLRLSVVAGVLASLLLGAPARALASSYPRQALSGLQHGARVVRDHLGIPHVYARSQHDAFFLNGYLHAQDRFFEMDDSRRQASGTQAELLGPGTDDAVLSSDVVVRMLGLRRAAERSAAAYPGWVMADLRAYAEGVNQWLARNPLPSEYAELELTKASVPRWTPLDSITILKFVSTQLSLDFQDLSNTQLLSAYADAGQASGFDGARLFFEDVARRAPFDATVTIAPGAASGAVKARRRSRGARPRVAREQVAAVADFVRRGSALGLGRQPASGSNWWLVSGAKSATGFPLLAGDPHLGLTSPSVWHEIGLSVTGERRDASGDATMNVYGTNFPGVPGVIHGFNNRLMWSSTTSELDVSDFFQERVVVEDGVPVATLYNGVAEPLVTIPQTFLANRQDGTPDDPETLPAGVRPSGLGVPASTLVVPRLNDGPLVTDPSGPPGEETAVGLAFTGFAPTREVEAVLRFDRARSLGDFKRALRFFDVGAQNWAVADRVGNIAYWSSGEAPLREDLQSETVAGLPPFFVRDGTGALPNGWIPQPGRGPDQALPYKVLPFSELPHVVNPAQGFVANANNDPVGDTLDNDPFNRQRPGGGIHYLASHYDSSSRQARIARLLRAKLADGGRLSRADMVRIQSDVTLVDAQVLKPFIQRAHGDAAAPGAAPELAALAADPALTEAVRRLGAWDGSTPTGIREGYDASDVNGERRVPSAHEAASSVAATIYALWRGRILQDTIGATLERAGLGAVPPPPDDQMMVALRRLLETFPTTHGVGASGLSFFDVPDVAASAEDERDIVILTSLRRALDLAASPAFAPAFAGSTRQADYRWGRLHRITFAHPLGGPFSLPPGAGFSDLSPSLPGIATDGGYETVDAATHDPRAGTPDGFTFGGGPSRRFIGKATPLGIRATQVIAGGESGEPTGLWFGNQLGTWLTNESHAALATPRAVARDAAATEVFTPAGG